MQNNRTGLATRRSPWQLLVLWSLAAAISGQVQVVGAEPSSGPYVGLALGFGQLQGSYAKTTDNRNARGVTVNDYSAMGRMYSARDEAESFGLGGGVLVGYQWRPGRLYLALELDAALHGDEVAGYYRGAGHSLSFRQFGESWPEAWAIERNLETGLTFKLGGRLGEVSGGNTALILYGLVGVRELKADFRLQYRGCSGVVNDDGSATITPCTALSDLGSGSSLREENFSAFTLGLGLVLGINEKNSLHFEVRRTDYDDIATELYERTGVVRVLQAIDADELGFAIAYRRHF